MKANQAIEFTVTIDAERVYLTALDAGDADLLKMLWARVAKHLPEFGCTVQAKGAVLGRCLSLNELVAEEMARRESAQ